MALKKPPPEVWARWKMGAINFRCYNNDNVFIGYAGNPYRHYDWPELKATLQGYSIYDIFPEQCHTNPTQR